MFCYFAYGLKIQSNIPIPEFLPADVGTDVMIRVESSGHRDINRLPAEAFDKPMYLKMDEVETTLALKNIGVFFIREGREIVVVPAPDVEISLIRLYLVGSMMAIALYQRGFLVLHASTVEVDGGAVAFLGMSGAGKSSTAAALYAQGHRIIADDVMAVNLDNHPVTVLPGFPQIKLSLEAAGSLGYDEKSLLLLHSQEEKRGCRITSNFPTTPLPLRCIYVLADGPDLEVEPLQPQETVIELLPHSIPTRWLQSGGALHFYQCANLAKAVPVYHLRRPRCLSRLPELAKFVEQHLAQDLEKVGV